MAKLNRPARSEKPASRPPAELDYHPTTYKPGNVAKTMPVLPPTLFRQPTPAQTDANGCPKPLR
jgi:hypothetical protein